MTEPLEIAAPAKLNAFLRVLGRRDDGYHDVQTLILPLDLADDVRIEPADGLELSLHGPHASEVPAGDGNLALVAARALRGRAATSAGARIVVRKRIPVAAGMGGGSADAAAVLRGLNELWGCGLGAEDLAEVAAAVGSDVPAMLHGGAVFADGRGTRVTPVHAPTSWWVVRPLELAVSSADAYAWWDEDPATGPDPGVLVAAVEAGNTEVFGPAAFNDLQGPVARRHPEVDGAIRELFAAGAVGAVMSGSGPTVVGAARSLGHAMGIAEDVAGSFAVSAA